MTGEFTFVYRNDSGINQKLSYKDLTFVTEQEDKTAYQEQVQILEAQKEDINATQKRVQQEMTVTETQIQAIQSMMDSTDKVLQKNAETFKWGA
jgi:peptidoglycan hydrolase CwlO-like protein